MYLGYKKYLENTLLIINICSSIVVICHIADIDPEYIVHWLSVNRTSLRTSVSALQSSFGLNYMNWAGYPWDRGLIY